MPNNKQTLKNHIKNAAEKGFAKKLSKKDLVNSIIKELNKPKVKRIIDRENNLIEITGTITIGDC